MGYTAWSAGAFSATDYNLTMTPIGSAGNFVDQQTVSRCVVGVRNGNLNSTKASGTAVGSDDSSKGTVAISASAKLESGGLLGTIIATIALAITMIG